VPSGQYISITEIIISPGPRLTTGRRIDSRAWPLINYPSGWHG